MTTYYCYHSSPIGRLLLVSNDEYLTLLGFPEGSMARRHETSWRQDASPLLAVSEQLNEYFAGERSHFELPLAPRGTAFQQQVWATLQQIPYGQTWSYGELASHIGKPSASRAVGAANGLNPIPIIIPCHRVIGANGKLTGFGGGLPTKEYLLRMEAEKLKPELGFA